MGFIIGGVVILALIGVCYIVSLKRTINAQKEELEDASLKVLECESALVAMDKSVKSFKREIQSLYKTIDEYTSEKDTVPCEVDITEKTLKKGKTKK